MSSGVRKRAMQTAFNGSHFYLIEPLSKRYCTIECTSYLNNVDDTPVLYLRHFSLVFCVISHSYSSDFGPRMGSLQSHENHLFTNTIAIRFRSVISFF